MEGLTPPPSKFAHNICSCKCGFGTCLGALFCYPCLFGRAQHRLDTFPEPPAKSSDGWLGLPCVLMCLAAHAGFGCIPVWMQRSQTRKKFNLEGSACTDCLAGCFCTCCAMAQHDTELRERSEKESLMGDVQEYRNAQGGMVYEPVGRDYNTRYSSPAASAAAASSAPSRSMEMGRLSQQHPRFDGFGGSPYTPAPPPAYTIQEKR